MVRSKLFINWSIFCEQKYKTSILRSDLCNYSDTYIVVKGTIDLATAVANENDKAQKNVAFKNNVPFR